jgi:hypothetical protein
MCVPRGWLCVHRGWMCSAGVNMCSAGVNICSAGVNMCSAGVNICSAFLYSFYSKHFSFWQIVSQSVRFEMFTERRSSRVIFWSDCNKSLNLQNYWRQTFKSDILRDGHYKVFSVYVIAACGDLLYLLLNSELDYEWSASRCGRLHPGIEFLISTG